MTTVVVVAPDEEPAIWKIVRVCGLELILPIEAHPPFSGRSETTRISSLPPSLLSVSIFRPLLTGVTFFVVNLPQNGILSSVLAFRASILYWVVIA